MVHLEVTAKENRALCITNRDIDKPTGALGNLDKGLFTHVRNWIHFLVGLCGALQLGGVHMLLQPDKCVPGSNISPKGQSLCNF